MSERIEYRGYIVLIEQDDDMESPDFWVHMEAFLGVVRHQRYRAFGRADYNYRPRDGSEGEAAAQWLDAGWKTFPVEVVDHGSCNGASLRFCEHDRCDGAIFVRHRSLSEQVANLVTTQEVAESVLKEWNMYLGGDVYRYRILSRPLQQPLPLAYDFDEADEANDSDREDLDSLGGIYGYDHAVQTAKEWIDWHVGDPVQEAVSQTRPVKELS